MHANHRLQLAAIVGLAASLMAGAAQAQTPSAALLTLDFSGPSPPPLSGGPGPPTGVVAPLVLANTGTFYGVDVVGMVFGMSAQGTMTPIYSFGSGYPNTLSPLTLASDGNFYGTMGPDVPVSGYEAAFRLTPAGVLTTIYTLQVDAFPGPPCAAQFGNVGNPKSQAPAGLIQGSDGNLYGVGVRDFGGSCTGSVFKMTLDGTLTLLHDFEASNGVTPSDGINPEGALVQGSDGNLYGTTFAGGTDNYGTVFQITPVGVLTTLHSFDQTDGAFPMTALVQGKDGSFYGTTSAGGASNLGTVFNISSTGAMTVLYSFTGQADGATPNGLTLGSDGNFYGTTEGGAESNCMPPACQAVDFGTIFMITPGGALTTLYTFGGPDGQTPLVSLVQGPDGNFYGSTSVGGLNGVGSVFKFSTGLAAAGQAIAPPPTDVTYTTDAGGNVVVSWSAVTGATSYNVYAGIDSQLDSVPVATPTTTSATLTDLPTGTNLFAVAWVSGSGTSGLSAAATDTSGSGGGSGGTGGGGASGGGGGVLETWMLGALGASALIAITQRARRMRHRNVNRFAR